MKLIILLISFSTFANDIDKYTLAMRNMARKYCSQGSELACKGTRYFEDPQASPTNTIPGLDQRKVTPDEINAAKEASAKLTACNKDLKCISDLTDKLSRAESAKKAKECAAGDKDACYLKDLVELNNLQQKAFLKNK